LIISIILPIFQEECLLPRALTSIASQSLFQNSEIILAQYDSPNLVDNLFEDVPIGIARKCKIIDIEKKGIGYARHRAIEQAEGKYLCNFDADAIFTKPNNIQRLLAPIQRGQTRMTQGNVTFNEDKISLDQMLQDVQNNIKNIIPYYVSEIGMCFSRSDYFKSERFSDVRNLEGARLAMDFVKRFGWGAIQKVDDVIILHEKRRGITDWDHENAYRCGRKIKIK